jgi:NagD protein
MTTADFLRRQEKQKSWVVGKDALNHELPEAGFSITDINPDFVIMGETHFYNGEMMRRAACFIARSARFIAPRIPAATILPGLRRAVRQY